MATPLVIDILWPKRLDYLVTVVNEMAGMQEKSFLFFILS